jgi:hypothetical protein
MGAALFAEYEDVLGRTEALSKRVAGVAYLVAVFWPEVRIGYRNLHRCKAGSFKPIPPYFHAVSRIFPDFPDFLQYV